MTSYPTEYYRLAEILEVDGSFQSSQHFNERQLVEIASLAIEFFSRNTRDDYEELYSEISKNLNMTINEVRDTFEDLEEYLKTRNREFIDPCFGVAYGSIYAACGRILKGGADLLEHPDVVQFRQNILEEYYPPDNAKLALFSPCAKGKPFRNSRTHNRIDKYLNPLMAEYSIGDGVIDLLVVSEPIGIVPREMDMHYPAMNYDMTMPSWLPLDKVNKRDLEGNDRTSTFTKVQKLSENDNAQARTAEIVEYLSKVVASFIEKHTSEYEKMIGYVRSTHRTILQLAADLADVKIEFIPTDSQIRDIIDERGRLHWAFQGLRGGPSLKILQHAIKEFIEQ